MSEEIEPTEEAVEAPEQEAPPEKAWSDEAEEEARAFGWKSPDEWKGDIPPGYIADPTAYIQRAESFTPFRKLKQQFDETRTAFEERVRKIEAMEERAREAQRKRYEAQIEELQAEKRSAVESADTDAYARAERQERALRESMVEPEPAPQAPTELREYVEANDWAKDPALWGEAVQAVNFMPNLGTASVRDQLAYAENVMRRKYPHLFAAPEPAAKQVSRVDAGGLGAKARSGFGSLPGEAKQAFKRFVDQGIFEDNDADRKRYFDEYNAA